MRTPRVVTFEPPHEPEHWGVGMLPKIDFLVLQASPEPLDERVVHPSAASVHAYPHPQPEKAVGPLLRGELASLVGVEDLRDPACGLRRVPKRLEAQAGFHRVGDRPAQHLARRPGDHRRDMDPRHRGQGTGHPQNRARVRPRPARHRSTNPPMAGRSRRSNPMAEGHQASSGTNV